MSWGRVLGVVGAVPVVLVGSCVRSMPQAQAATVERFGRYTRTLNAGLNIVVPFIDTVRDRIDLREQVVPFPPQPVITEDNLVVDIDTVIYYQVTDARAATYEVVSYIEAIEQVMVTTLRTLVSGMDLERVLTSREELNRALHWVLDEATGKWGVRVNRVEIKAIELPVAVREAKEREMRARSDAAIARVLAEGERDAALLRARTERDVAKLHAPDPWPDDGMLRDES